MTHFQIVYRKDPPPLHPFVLGETKITDLEEQLLQQDAMLKVLHSNFACSQVRDEISHLRLVTWPSFAYNLINKSPLRKNLMKSSLHDIMGFILSPKKLDLWHTNCSYLQGSKFIQFFMCLSFAQQEALHSLPSPTFTNQ